jgi:hypothetical protein
MLRWFNTETNAPIVAAPGNGNGSSWGGVFNCKCPRTHATKFGTPNEAVESAIPVLFCPDSRLGDEHLRLVRVVVREK